MVKVGSQTDTLLCSIFPSLGTLMAYVRVNSSF